MMHNAPDHKTELRKRSAAVKLLAYGHVHDRHGHFGVTKTQI